MLFVKMQLACLGVLLYVFFYFSGDRIVKTISTKLFKAMIVAAIFHTLFDAITVVQVNNLDLFPMKIIDVCHVFFFTTINVFAVLTFFYIASLVNCKSLYRNSIQLIFILPIIIVEVITIIVPVSYRITEHVSNAVGFTAKLCYFCIFFYILFSFHFIVRYRRDIDKRKKKTIIPALLIMTAAYFTQVLIPTILLSSMGIMLVVLGVFLSRENPIEFIDIQTGCFNKSAMIKAVNEFIRKKKTFGIIVLFIEEIDIVSKETNDIEKTECCIQLKNYLKDTFQTELYIIRDKCFGFFIRDYSMGKFYIEDLEEWFKERDKGKNNSTFFKSDINMISFENKEELTTEKIRTKIIGYIEVRQENYVYKDDLLDISNRNAFERDISYLNQLRIQLKPIWIMIVDINNLKEKNDKEGHVAGDKMLRTCVDILKLGIDENSKLYRVGGDEICIISTSVSDCIYSNLVKKILIKQSQTAVGNEQVSFAIGYRKYDKNRDRNLRDTYRRADKAMYENKIMIKGNVNAR